MQLLVLKTGRNLTEHLVGLGQAICVGYAKPVPACRRQNEVVWMKPPDC